MVTYTMWFESCDRVEPVSQGTLGHSTNFFIDDDPEHWVSDARSFSEVLYKGLYDGVDARFYFKDGMLKYDLIVAPLADIDGIVLLYEGIDGLAIDETTGDLLIHTRLGTICDARPVILQDQERTEVSLPGDFACVDGHRATFVLPEGISRDGPIIIDPGIIFSTFLGGSDTEWGRAVDVQSDGTIVVAGETTSKDFPIPKEAGSYDRNGSRLGTFDIFVARLDPTGSRLLSATYFGGSDIDMCRAMELGPDGSVYILGWTYSKDLPLKGPLMDHYMGDLDLVVVKLSRDCSALLYSTYFGGKGDDWCLDITIWKDGSIYFGGSTNSSDFPVTDGAYCTTYAQNRTDFDFFIAKINGTLSSIDFCTYIGGSGTEGQTGQYHCMCVTPSGQPVIFGGTTSRDIPMTPGVHRGVKTTNETDTDATVMVLDPTGSRLLRATYFGGTKYEMAYAILVGSDGAFYIAGMTASEDLEVTDDATCTTLSNETDGFLAVLEPSLASVRYCTYLGGSGDEHVSALAWGPDERILYLMMATSSWDIMTTAGAFDSKNRNTNVWLKELLIMGIGTVNHSVVYSTYFGGGGDDYDPRTYRDIRVDAQGMLYLVGVTTSPDLPTTAGACCRTYNKGFMAYVAKLDPRPCPPPDPPSALDALGLDERVSLHWDRLPQSVVYEGCRISCLRLYKGASPAGLSLQAELNWTNSSYEDMNLTNGARYYYGLTVVTNAGEGPRAAISARPMHLPTEPIGLSLETGNRSMLLNWSAPMDSGGELQGYRVYRGETASDLRVIVTLGNVTAFEDPGVDCRKQYWYAVSAFNEKGEGRRGSSQYRMPQGPPAPPEGFMADAGDTIIRLSWSSTANDGGYEVLGYRLYKGRTSHLTQDDRLKQFGGDVREFTDTDVVNAQEYWYAITAYSLYGEDTSNFVVIKVVPFTLPGRPVNLIAVPGDASANLTWAPPTTDGGRPVTAYRIYYGKTRDSLGLTCLVGNVIEATVTGLRNGDAYFFKVAAVNEAGEGLASDDASAVPMGPPAPPTDLTAMSSVGGVRISWMPPADLGGAKSVSYRVYRMGPDQQAVLIKEVTDGLQCLDGDVGAGTSYSYWITAITPEGREGGPSNVCEVVARTAPGPLATLSTAIVAPGGVDLHWDAPGENGGSPITNYSVYRGLSPTSLERIVTIGPILSYSDRDVQNGLVYYYTVRAVNEFGEGPGPPPVNATPLGLPLPPLSLRVVVEGDRVTLTWAPALEAGRAPIMGYVVYRGASKGSLKRLDELGDVRSYTDALTERGKTYYYSVVAVSDIGEGERSAPISASTPIALGSVLLVLLVVVIACVATAVAVRRRKATAMAVGKVASTEGEMVVTVETAVKELAPTTSATGTSGQRPGYVIEEVFVVSRDGRLMADCAREYCRTRDADLMSGLLIAIQGIIQDGLRREEALESVKYGDSLIMIASGPSVHLAVVVYGEPDDELRDALESTVEGIEATYAGVLAEWTGDFTMTTGIEGLAMPLVRRTEHLTRQDVAALEAPPGVDVLSAVDFHRGYVRLKVAAVNGTEELVADAAIDVHYNPDMLRLERVEPATLKPKGDRVNLGTVKPGERATVAFLFDPQICQGTHIDGVLNYYDTRGAAHHVQMKRRTADVVCPIFFTREHANTAMLRRLIKERLHQSDLRVLHYPDTVAPQEALRMAKSALGGEGVQLVREYVVGGPPYEAEAWYYGETKVKGYQMVMRLGVLEERRVLEIFVASTAMEPITGLLAEFRRQLDRALRERYGRTASMDPATDETLLRQLEGRKLHIESEARDAGGGAREGVA